MANGNAYDAQGRIVTCEHATSRLVRAEHDGTYTVLASHFKGHALNSPNDVIVHRDGRIFFTDPTFGRMPYYGVERKLDLACRGVYWVPPDGAGVVQIADDFGQPNGLCFSLNQRQLFVNDTERGHIRCFEVHEGGAISGGDIWAELTGEGVGHPDGMKIDAAGNLYCTGPGGVHVIASDGVCLGVIEMPEMTANFTWGGPNMKTLFFTASTALYRAPTKTPGLPAF
jgi:gluconolactonase